MGTVSSSRIAAMFVMSIACGRPGDEGDREPAPSAAQTAAPSPRVAELPPAKPEWLVRLPREPGAVVVRSVAGPAVAGDIAVVGATGSGWVALGVSAGDVLWRLEGEERPSHASASATSFALYGECADLRDATNSDRAGCMREVSAASGELTGVSWLRAAPDVVESFGAVEVVDEALRGPGWEADDRYHAIVGEAAGGVLAIRLTGGIGPVVVSRDDGSIVARGDSIPALHVLAYARTPAGLAIAVRVDSTLHDDAIVYFDSRHRLASLWPLPRPQQPRVEAVGLAATSHGVVGFYDGRFAVHLAVENSDTVTP